MSDWKEKKINELGTISRGRSRHRPRDDKSLYGGRYPFIQTGDVKSAEFYLNKYNQTYNEKGLLQSKLWKKDTLCITIAANIAETAILKMDACFPDSIVGFIPFDGVSDVRFVKYSFDMLKKEMQAVSLGATQDNFSVEKMMKFKFIIPNLHTQERIADILSTYDELIENNNRRIELLEKAAQELYKEWFVRFRFPNHENTQFVNGLPEGWNKDRLDSISKIIMGQSPSSEYYNNEFNGLPFHQGVGSYGGRFVIDETYSSEGKKIAEENSILFSVRAPVGRMNITKNKVIIGRGLAAMNHNKGLNSYLYLLLKEIFYKDDLIGNGAIFSSITKTELFAYKVLIPSNGLTYEFNEIVKAIDDEISSIYLKTINLKKQRDLLLPRLMSGKLEV